MFWKTYSIVGMQSRQWDSTVFNDTEGAGNWGNQIESKQPFYFYSVSACQVKAAAGSWINYNTWRGHSGDSPLAIYAQAQYYVHQHCSHSFSLWTPDTTQTMSEQTSRKLEKMFGRDCYLPPLEKVQKQSRMLSHILSPYVNCCILPLWDPPSTLAGYWSMSIHAGLLGYPRWQIMLTHNNFVIFYMHSPNASYHLH